jgi:hypothetical protein
MQVTVHGLADPDMDFVFTKKLLRNALHAVGHDVVTEVTVALRPEKSAELYETYDAEEAVLI